MSTTFSIREIYNNTANSVEVLIGNESSAKTLLELKSLGLTPDDVCGLLASNRSKLDTFFLLAVSDGKGMAYEFDAKHGNLLHTFEGLFEAKDVVDSELVFDAIEQDDLSGLVVVKRDGSMQISPWEGAPFKVSLPVEWKDAKIDHLQFENGDLYYHVVGKGIYTAQLTGQSFESGAKLKARPLASFSDEIVSMRFHRGDLYYSTPDTMKRVGLTLSNSKDLLPAYPDNHKCVTLLGMVRWLYDSSDDHEFTGDYFYAVLRDKEGNCGLYAILKDEKGKVTLVKSALDFGRLANQFSRISLNYLTGKFIVLAGGELFSIDATEGVPFDVAASAYQLMSSTVDVPSTSILPIELDSNETGLKVTHDATEGYVFHAGKSGGSTREVPLHGNISENNNNLIRLELGLDGGGHVIISVIDLDPGQIHGERMHVIRYGR